MKNSYKDDNFGSRIANKAKARQAIQERIKARPGPGDPEFEKIRAEREAISAARQQRLAERKAEKEEKLAREKAEREAREQADGKMGLVRHLASGARGFRRGTRARRVVGGARQGLCGACAGGGP